MGKIKRQIDMQISDLHVREAQGEDRGRTVEGYAVVFGVRSVNLIPWSNDRVVYEIMESGCIDQELLNRSDVVLTAFHNNQMILGRWRQGKGTLNLILDERGLKTVCTLADTASANELLSAIDRGDITGMSFAFTADEDDNENGVSYERTSEMEGGKVVWLRHVKRVTGLYDVTIAGHPAYEQTSIEARELSDAIERACGKDDRRDDDEDLADITDNDDDMGASDDDHDNDTNDDEEEARKREVEQAIHRARRRHLNDRFFFN